MGVQKHHKKLLGGSPCQNFLPKKLRAKKVHVVFRLRFFYRVFFGSLHEELKKAIEIFSTIRPDLQPQKSQKNSRQVGGPVGVE
jgi:hypothetical protein